MGQSQETKVENYNNDDLLGKTDSIVVREQKKLIQKDLEERKLDQNYEESVEILVHQLAITQLKLDFEKIYNIIYGSQIFLLKKLNESSRHKKDIDKYVSDTLNENEALNDWTQKEYLNFLFTSTLIIFDADKEIYIITNLGHEFLLWLLHTGNNEHKRL